MQFKFYHMECVCLFWKEPMSSGKSSPLIYYDRPQNWCLLTNSITAARKTELIEIDNGLILLKAALKSLMNRRKQDLTMPWIFCAVCAIQINHFFLSIGFNQHDKIATIVPTATKANGRYLIWSVRGRPPLCSALFTQIASDAINKMQWMADRQTVAVVVSMDRYQWFCKEMEERIIRYQSSQIIVLFVFDLLYHSSN